MIPTQSGRTQISSIRDHLEQSGNSLSRQRRQWAFARAISVRLAGRDHCGAAHLLVMSANGERAGTIGPTGLRLRPSLIPSVRRVIGRQLSRGSQPVTAGASAPAASRWSRGGIVRSTTKAGAEGLTRPSVWVRPQAGPRSVGRCRSTAWCRGFPFVRSQGFRFPDRARRRGTWSPAPAPGFPPPRDSR